MNIEENQEEQVEKEKDEEKEEFIEMSKIEGSNVYELNLKSEIPAYNVNQMVDDMIKVAFTRVQEKEAEMANEKQVEVEEVKVEEEKEQEVPEEKCEIIENEEKESIRESQEDKVENMSQSISLLQEQMSFLKSQVDMMKNKSPEVVPDKSNKTVHQFVTCDHCRKGPITGKRFKCLVCLDYDHCESCEIQHPHEHDMIVLKKNTHRGLIRKIMNVYQR